MASFSSESKVIRVLVVDDDDAIRQRTVDSLQKDPRIEVIAEANDGAVAIDAVKEHKPDVVIMDVYMPTMDGCVATEKLSVKYPGTKVVALTEAAEVESLTRMIVAGAVGYAIKGASVDKLAQVVVDVMSEEYFVDPSAVDELFASVVHLAREEHELRVSAERIAVELKQAYRETVTALVNALKSRDNDTEEHGDRVASLVLAVGKRLGLKGRKMIDLEYSALFHDIGKLAVPDVILYNEDDLTEQEWEIIRQHTVVGEQILRPISFLNRVARIVRCSHENWDGTGYPDGLSGEDIPLESRIVFVCDAYDAMTTQRTYQKAFTQEAAIARMSELSGVHFDPQVVDALIAELNDVKNHSVVASSEAK